MKSSPSKPAGPSVRISDGPSSFPPPQSAPPLTPGGGAASSAAGGGGGGAGIFGLTEVGLEAAGRKLGGPNPWDLGEDGGDTAGGGGPSASWRAEQQGEGDGQGGAGGDPSSSSAAAAAAAAPAAEVVDEAPMAPYRREEMDLWYPTHKRLVKPAIHSQVTADIRAMLLAAPEIVARLRPAPTISRATIEYLSTRRAPAGDSEYHFSLASPVEWARWKTAELAASRHLQESSLREWAAEEEARRLHLEGWRRERQRQQEFVDTELAARRTLAATYGRKVAKFLSSTGPDAVAQYKEKHRAALATAAKLKSDRESNWGTFSKTVSGALRVGRQSLAPLNVPPPKEESSVFSR